MGAYTLAAGSNFNGFDSQAVDVHYVFSPPVVRPRPSPRRPPLIPSSPRVADVNDKAPG